MHTNHCVHISANESAASGAFSKTNTCGKLLIPQVAQNVKALEYLFDAPFSDDSLQKSKASTQTHSDGPLENISCFYLADI